AAARGARREHDVRRVEHLVRDARPPRARQHVPGDRAEPRADERDHGRALAAVRGGRAGERPPAWPRRVRRAVDQSLPRAAGGCSGVVSFPAAPLELDHAGPDRVRLSFVEGLAEAKVGAETRVPAGTTLFDAASWNGIAIDSTCGGHGTCKKCKVRVVSGSVPVGSVDPRAFSVEELKDGWRLACRAEATEDLVVYVPPLQTRPKAALAG